jgi:hypothetical protein
MTILFLLAGCNNDSPSGLAVVKMRLGERTLTLEVANTYETREKGLMRRDSMASDHGMIFVFKDEERRGFWMKNTRIPLDIVYIDSAGKIVSIHQMKPHDLHSTPADGPMKFAIELNKGVAAKLKLAAGQQLEIPAEAREARE